MLTAALLLFWPLTWGRNIIFHCIQEELIKASPSCTNLAAVRIELELCCVQNFWICWKDDHMKHFRLISWVAWKHVKPSIYEIVLRGHVQTFVDVGFLKRVIWGLLLQIWGQSQDLQGTNVCFCLIFSYSHGKQLRAVKHEKQVWLIW